VEGLNGRRGLPGTDFAAAIMVQGQWNRKMQRIEIRVKGHVNEKWSEWFGGLAISHSDPDETLLTGMVSDRAALYGILARLRDLGLQLSSVSTEGSREGPRERTE